MKEKIVTMGVCEGVNQPSGSPEKERKWTSVSIGLDDKGLRTVGCKYLKEEGKCNFENSALSSAYPVDCKHLYPKTAAD